jgi:hypothetical protein
MSQDQNQTTRKKRDRNSELWAVVRKLPTDYTDYGGEIKRWSDGNTAYPDCSCGCRWAVKLTGSLGNDWIVCSKPGAPRAGLVTWEHQTGSVCFER